MSIHYKKPVTTVAKERLPWSLSVMGVSLILSLVTGYGAGAVWNAEKKFDRAAFRILSALTEVPAYLVGLLLLFQWWRQRFHGCPLSRRATARYETAGEKAWDLISHGFLPVLSSRYCDVSRIYFTARASFPGGDVEPYLMNARGQGAESGKNPMEHIFRNGMTPIVVRFFLNRRIRGVGGTIC